LNEKFIESILDLKEKFPLLIEIPSKNEKLKFGGELFFSYFDGKEKLDEESLCWLKIILIGDKLILKLMTSVELKEKEIMNKACKFYLETL